MSTLMRVYADEAAAMRAVEQLMAAGVPGNDIQLIKDENIKAANQERVGTFDDEDANRKRVGTFNDSDARTVREGSFDDTGDHLHNVREEPKGSFANIDGLPHVLNGDVYATAQTAGFERTRVEQALVGASAGCITLIVNTQALDSTEAERVLG